jgi:hypothetical protein
MRIIALYRIATRSRSKRVLTKRTRFMHRIYGEALTIMSYDYDAGDDDGGDNILLLLQ